MRNPIKPYFYLFLFVLLGCTIINFRFGYPLPKKHDEFSYLLAADTFSKGRLTNPTHPQWRFFESFHIIHKPSYQSKYPPGQGMQLAMGIFLAHPIHGVWLTLCLWAMALFWMLQGGGIARHWAFFASLIGIAQFGIFSYFGHSYWGGSLFGFAGTLVFGATLYALRDQISISNMIIMGLGLLIIINTRPFEGMIFCLIPMIFFIIKLYKDEHLAKKRKVFVSSIVIFFTGMGVFFHAYYNKQVTGHWLLMPYSVYQSEYMPGYPKFVFEKAGEIKKTRYKEFETFQSLHANIKKPLTAKKYFLNLIENIGKILTIFFPAFWLVAAFFSFAACLSLGEVEPKLAWCTLCAMFAVLFLSVSANRAMWPHYFAAWLPVAVYILADGVAHFKRIFDKKNKILKNLLVIMIIVQLLGPSVLTLFSNTGYKTRSFSNFQFFRDQAEQKLADMTRENGIKHVVMVKYVKGHNIHEEWVYNGADIDSQNVVWARWISHKKNKPLVKYYDDRKKWVLEVGSRGVVPMLMAYE
jgi:hypothetical protein